jgi:hypothetical protein
MLWMMLVLFVGSSTVVPYEVPFRYNSYQDCADAALWISGQAVRYIGEIYCVPDHPAKFPQDMKPLKPYQYQYVPR